LFVFDVLIGNWDRAGNVKATLRGSSRPFICGFDHANSLLMAAGDSMYSSISVLEQCSPLLSRHMFGPYVSARNVAAWVAKIRAVPPEMIRGKCVLSQSVNQVDCAAQAGLARALMVRLEHLELLCGQLLTSARRGRV
jgi:hypothetical protein